MSADPLVFVDTNVLVYAHDLEAGAKREIARTTLESLWSTRRGTLSTQVLEEFYVTLTRKLARPVTRADGRDLVAAYAAWPVQRIDADDVIAASELEEAHSLSFWDALIIVSARRAGAARLLTEDLHDGQTVAGVTVENPFA